MQKSGKYGLLNVVLQPHPTGAYRELFERAARDTRAIKYYGERFAKISPISKTREGVFTGRLATWAEIDPDSNMIEKKSLNEMLLSEAEFRLPDNVGFNSRVFSFAFRVADHRLYIETRNDENENISINLAKTAFQRIFELAVEETGEEVDVFVVSSSSALKRVLETPHLRYIEIQVDLPNPDVLTANKKEVVDSLIAMKAKRLRFELTKKAGEDRLTLTKGVTALAELSTENGYSKAIGKEEDGSPIERSTKDFPMEIETILAADESRAAATRRIAESNAETPG